MTDRYREHRIRSSLDHAIGEAATSEAHLRLLIVQARKVGVIVFLKADLDRLPGMSRALIESEHKRLCQRSGSR